MMETMPMALDALGAGGAGLDEFRITSPREIVAVLKQLCDGNVQLNLNASDGSAVGATLWSMDPDRGCLGFDVEPNDHALQALQECEEAVVVAYLDSVKVQFDVHDLVLVHGLRASVLNGSFPRQLFRFQRRNAYRVRPPMRHAPTARVRHTDIGDLELALRVLDLSIGGCALFLPDDMPAMRVGALMQPVHIELDADTRFVVGLRLMHVTSLNGAARGVRLGCEFVRPDSSTLRALQCFIDQTQKRAKLLSLD